MCAFAFSRMKIIRTTRSVAETFVFLMLGSLSTKRKRYEDDCRIKPDDVISSLGIRIASSKRHFCVSSRLVLFGPRSTVLIRVSPDELTTFNLRYWTAGHGNPFCPGSALLTGAASPRI